jgi:multidrug resistance efflux pump
MNVQVFTPYPGRIIQTYADLGDLVKKDQILFTIESPDFIAAESNLIGAAATLERPPAADSGQRAAGGQGDLLFCAHHGGRLRAAIHHAGS